MKKRFSLSDLDCAACAAKMETAVKRIDGVHDASVSFMPQAAAQGRSILEMAS